MKITTCRSCAGGPLQEVLDLGLQPLANRLPSSPHEEEPHFPLRVVECPICGLVQIDETVPPEELFSDYAYFSSYSDTMLEHARALTSRIITEEGLGSEDLVVELASNDGYLLSNYVDASIPVLGVEPAANVARVAEGRGVSTRVAFFSEQVAGSISAEHGPARVIHAHNVLAHVANLNGFVEGIARLLESEGVAVIEFPYLGTLLERAAFDTIYHEHLCYFSLTSVAWLLSRHDLQVDDVEQISIHGGSLRLFVRHCGRGRPTPRVAELLEAERAQPFKRGLAALNARVKHVRQSVRAFVQDARARGKTVAGYGAAAKATVLLNHIGLSADDVEFVADRSPYKQGRYVPGTKIPIVDPDALADRRPDFCLLFAWNFAPEIRRQQAAYERAGGRFVVPVPEARILETEDAAA